MAEKVLILTSLFITSLVSITLALVAWHKKDAGISAIFLSLALVGAAIYAFGYAMEIISDSLSNIFFWVRFQHWGIQLITPTWLLFSLSVSGYEKRITKKLISAVCIIPVYLFLSAQTLGWLNLAHQNPHVITYHSISLLAYDRNIFNYISVGYYSLCLLISTILFGIMLFRSVPYFRRQAMIYLLGSLPPWIVAILYNLNLTSSKLDFVPLALGLGGVIFAVGFLRFRVLDIIPLARNTIFEKLPTGVLILDNANRITDFNPAFQKIFPDFHREAIGSSVEEYFARIPSLINLLADEDVNRVEFKSEEFFGTPLYYRVSLSKMTDRFDRQVGTILNFFEYTHEKELLDELEKQARLDGLTGVFNRQHFDQIAQREIYRHYRYGEELSLIMLDLDQFKKINDTYGHGAGDKALVALTEAIQQKLRQSDSVARIGGEEFLILLPETSPEDAVKLTERLREAINALIITCEEYTFNMRASFGVTAIEPSVKIDLDTFYRLADNAMYQAKEQGGNCVCVCLPETTLQTLPT